MLAGRAPFVDDDAVVVMAKHIKNEPPEFEEVAADVEIPLPVEALVRHALEKLPENRPKSAEQMLHELEQASATSRAVESGVRPHVAGDDLPESLRLAERRTWVLGGLLAAALALLLALGIAVWGKPNTRVSTALQPTTPTVAPSLPLGSALENSVADASVNAPTSSVNEAVMPAGVGSVQRPPAAAQGVKKAAPKTTKTAPLERRGNERYGRFD
jgi:serine/threonine-protein kinase